MSAKNFTPLEEMRIRKATSAELQEILRHRREMFRDMGLGDAAALDAMQRTSETFIRDAMAAQKLIAWFAETPDAAIIGGVSVLVHPWLSSPLDPRPEHAYVLNMYVYPRHRRKGVARRLMRHALDWCRKAGFRAVYLHASDAGRAIYEQLGFKPTNEMRLEFPVESAKYKANYFRSAKN